MTTHAPDVTSRYKATYVSCGLQHSNVVRFARGLDPTTIVSQGRALLQELYGELVEGLPADFAFISAAYCPEDTNVYIPTTFVPVVAAGPNAVSLYSPNIRATETTFIGAGGSTRVSIAAFGILWDLASPSDPAANGRVQALESTLVASAVAVLNSGSGQVSASGDAAHYYAYANVKVNDYWLGRVRKLFV